jgi:hypothetical protein
MDTPGQGIRRAHAARMHVSTAFMILSAAISTGGCSISSFDEDVFASVDRAVLDVDAQRPADLAVIDVQVTFDAGPRAQHEITLGGVDLIDPNGPALWSLPLALALPAGFDPRFEPDEMQTAQLANIRVTNNDLIVACTRTSQLRVKLGYVEDPGTWTYGYAAAVLTCRP